jgi:hypothetical protein
MKGAAVSPCRREVHILRHSFCSRLSMRGAPAKAIQELAGHADLTMTQRYMHLSPAALDAAISLLERPSGAQTCGDILETAGPPPKQSIKMEGKLAVRQGFEPWVEVLAPTTV